MVSRVLRVVVDFSHSRLDGEVAVFGTGARQTRDSKSFACLSFRENKRTLSDGVKAPLSLDVYLSSCNSLGVFTQSRVVDSSALF